VRGSVSVCAESHWAHKLKFTRKGGFFLNAYRRTRTNIRGDPGEQSFGSVRKSWRESSESGTRRILIAFWF